MHWACLFDTGRCKQLARGVRCLRRVVLYAPVSLFCRHRDRDRRGVGLVPRRPDRLGHFPAEPSECSIRVISRVRLRIPIKFSPAPVLNPATASCVESIAQVHFESYFSALCTCIWLSFIYLACTCAFSCLSRALLGGWGGVPQAEADRRVSDDSPQTPLYIVCSQDSDTQIEEGTFSTSLPSNRGKIEEGTNKEARFGFCWQVRGAIGPQVRLCL